MRNAPVGGRQHGHALQVILPAAEQLVGHLLVHAVAAEEQALRFLALLGAAVLVIDRLQILDLRHDERAFEAIDDPACEPDMIGMRMGDDQPRDVDVLQRPFEQSCPGGNRLFVAEAGVDHRPAVVVGKRGTATLSVDELRHRILPQASLAAEDKIVFDWSQLGEHLDLWRRQGQRIGFTNGVFDLLHPGHVKLLAQARAACDRLVVGLNSDASVTRLKGPTRPVQNAQSRAEVLAALEAVDLVVIFEQDTPRELIAEVKPWRRCGGL